MFDAAGARVGTGYSEAVGYVNPLATQLGLAGLPVTPEMIALFSPPDVTKGDLQARSLLYLATHLAEFKTLMDCASMPAGPRPADCGAAGPAPGPAAAPATEEIVRLMLERLHGAL